jgi:phosphonopyruvate decarboxylase
MEFFMKAGPFVETLMEEGFSPFTGVPCSVFKHLINYINDYKKIGHYICSSEGEAMGIAGGLALAGRIPVVYMQVDGYGNAVNPLSSLQLMYRLPALLLVSWRGEPGTNDAPQHQIMGSTIEKFMSVLQIPYTIMDEEHGNFLNTVQTAMEHVRREYTPYAFVIRKGYFESYEPLKKQRDFDFSARFEYIQALAGMIRKEDVLLGATGFTGRELYKGIDFPGKFYMMGSMGCLAATGLGIAVENAERVVYVLDGDGAVLMKMGSLSTIGYYRPKNLIHICFDNNVYESTGCQKTTSGKTNLAKVAEACGYTYTNTVSTVNDFKKILSNNNPKQMPCFLHVKVRTGTLEVLSRPSDEPEVMRDNLMRFLKG